MKKIYLTDNARKKAIEDIWAEIDAIMSLSIDAMDYDTAMDAVRNLNKVADLIYEEVEDKEIVKRYKGE